MDSKTIKNAAITARLLGYRVHRNFRGDVGEVWAIEVCRPNGLPVLHLWNWSEYPEFSDIQLLGHWKVRLDMEKCYGISTPHYWENVNFTQKG
jgi:hypothetical protein